MKSLKTRVLFLTTVLIGLALMLVNFVRLSNQHSQVDTSTESVPLSSSIIKSNRLRSINCTKWIVSTKRVDSEELTEWCMVVVGLKASGIESNRTVHLNTSVLQAMSERYQSVQSLRDIYEGVKPMRVRRLIGYLYAIENGAQQILEESDGSIYNSFVFGNRFHGLEFIGCDNSSSSNSSLFINTYAYFGQPTMWPRGFPAGMVSESISSLTKCPRFRVFDSSIPLIQQGPVSLDVDEIYRATRVMYNKPLGVSFDEYAPPLVLNKHQYAPFGGSNGLYQYDALWLLVFPVNSSISSEILRSQMTIRLIREIDGRIAFMPPSQLTALNKSRTGYSEINRLITVLEEWNCDSLETVRECLIDCVRHLISKRFLDSSQLKVYTLWIESLDQIGYQWPSKKRPQPAKDKKINIFYKSIEQMHSSSSNENEESMRMKNNHLVRLNHIKGLCEMETNSTIDSLDKAVLITSADSIDQLKLLSLFWRAHFSYIVVCWFNKDVRSLANSLDLVGNSTDLNLIICENENYHFGFDQCVDYTYRMGFKQNVFFIAKSVSEFSFWSSNIKFEPRGYTGFESGLFAVRRNDTTTIITYQIKTGKAMDELGAYCDYFKQNKLKTILNQLINLN